MTGSHLHERCTGNGWIGSSINDDDDDNDDDE